jgi:hypothetical protein
LKKIIGTITGKGNTDFDSQEFIIELSKLFFMFGLDLKTVEDYQSHNEEGTDSYVKQGEQFRILIQGKRRRNENI